MVPIKTRIAMLKLCQPSEDRLNSVIGIILAILIPPAWQRAFTLD